MAEAYVRKAGGEPARLLTEIVGEIESRRAAMGSLRQATEAGEELRVLLGEADRPLAALERERDAVDANKVMRVGRLARDAIARLARTREGAPAKMEAQGVLPCDA